MYEIRRVTEPINYRRFTIYKKTFDKLKNFTKEINMLFYQIKGGWMVGKYHSDFTLEQKIKVLEDNNYRVTIEQGGIL